MMPFAPCCARKNRPKRRSLALDLNRVTSQSQAHDNVLLHQPPPPPPPPPPLLLSISPAHLNVSETPKLFVYPKSGCAPLVLSVHVTPTSYMKMRVRIPPPPSPHSIILCLFLTVRSVNFYFLIMMNTRRRRCCCCRRRHIVPPARAHIRLRFSLLSCQSPSVNRPGLHHRHLIIFSSFSNNPLINRQIKQIKHSARCWTSFFFFIISRIGQSHKRTHT